MSLKDLSRRLFRRAVTPPQRRNTASLMVNQLEDRCVPAAISGLVFYDTNADGIQNNNESTAPGVAVSCTPMGGSPVSGTTDSLGWYGFLELASGSYTVAFTAPLGYSVGTPMGGSTLVWIGTENVNVNAGLVQNSSPPVSPPPPGVPPLSPPPPGGDQDPGLLDDPGTWAYDGSAGDDGIGPGGASGNDGAGTAADGNEIKYQKVTAQKVFDALTAAKDTDRGKQLIKGIKDYIGVDPTAAADQTQWGTQNTVFGVVKQNGNRTSGGALQAVQHSVKDFANAPQKDKASIIQSMKVTVKLFDANSNEIGNVPVVYEVEGFAVDANGVAKDIDLHLMASKIGHVVNNKTVASVSLTRDVTVGWGTFKDKGQPNPYTMFYSGKDAPPAESITWLGAKATYDYKYTLNVLGEWTWNDESTGDIFTGTDGTKN